MPNARDRAHSDAAFNAHFGTRFRMSVTCQIGAKICVGNRAQKRVEKTAQKNVQIRACDLRTYFDAVLNAPFVRNRNSCGFRGAFGG